MSRDVIFCHVTASSCELQSCKKWNSQYTWVFGLLQKLPGDFRSNEVTLGSLSVTWGHVTSFAVTWLPPPASNRLGGSEMHSIRVFLAFYNHFLVTLGQMTSFPGHLRSCDVIFCHVTASSCELQPCRKWNVHHTEVFGLLKPLPGDFRSNDVTSGSLLVTWSDVMSFPVTWLPPNASYTLLGSEIYIVREFLTYYTHFQVTSGQMTSLPGHYRSPESRDIITCHVTAFACELQRCGKWNVQCTWVIGLLQPLAGDFRVTSVHLRSLTSFPIRWLLPRASYSLVGSEMYSVRVFLPIYRHFQVTSGHFTSLSVTWGHVTSFPATWLPPASYCLLKIEIYSIWEFLAFYSNFQETSGQMTLLGPFWSPEAK